MKHKGLVTGWANARFQDPVDPQFGVRYIPEFFLAHDVSDTLSLDAEFSLNAYGTAVFKGWDNITTDGNIKPYRLWARMSSSQFEVRLGLQKINFGPAMLLRSLMWFDSIDPRDPLQLTDGVYGVLARYYFVNNANLWLWGLYGNDDPKGLEAMPTKDNTLEWGGRAQFPLGKGEAALTYHHRQIDFSGFPFPRQGSGRPEAPENRFALDGKWDVGVGLWFEAALIHQDYDTLPRPWNRALTLGIDYTFDLGNGLNVLAEHFMYTSSEKAFGQGEGIDFTGLFINYPMSILDTVNTIFFYNWDNKDIYSFVNWQRTYDRWSFHLMAFWNPLRFEIYPERSDGSQFIGKGFQIMVVFNY
ncbi:MAG: hypothetical protein WBB73_17145 [Candidatus Aminicenantaceae bacterium]